MTDPSPRILSILRIVAALMFMEHGLMKLFHFPIAEPSVPDPLPAMLMIAAIFEIVCGASLTLGFFTRVAAFIASGEMAAAYFIGHLPSGYSPGMNGGGEAVLYCFIFLYIASAGGGAWSIDTLLGAKPGAGSDTRAPATQWARCRTRVAKMLTFGLRVCGRLCDRRAADHGDSRPRPAVS